MEQIRDMIFVNQLEKRLGRTLDEDELSGDVFQAQFPDGHVEHLAVPLLDFPHDLMPEPEVLFCDDDQEQAC